jgi:hypothetical protein
MKQVLSGRTASLLRAPSALCVQAMRGYRIFPHLDTEVEEFAEINTPGKYYLGCRQLYNGAPKQGEIMLEKINQRHRKRRGTYPEKAMARRLSQMYADHGKTSVTNYTVKTMLITAVGFDGHHYKMRVTPHADMTVNHLIDGSGLNYGWPQFWGRCSNYDCSDWLHGDGCLMNCDIDTLAKLPVPTRLEWSQLTHYRSLNRADAGFNARFSCQIRISEELDGAVFALKQFNSKALRGMAMDWFEVDYTATIALHKCRRVEPWAPMLEEPTMRDFPITWEMLWANDWEAIYQEKYPNYRRKDGFHTKPESWASYC